MRNLFILLFVLFSQFGFANISKPPEPSSGNVIGDSPMRNITVLHENLRFDFTDMPSSGLVKVSALYKLRSLADIKNLDLIFVANNLERNNYTIILDGKRISGVPFPCDAVPPSWLPPDTIAFGKRRLPYLYHSEGLIRFGLKHLSAGEHILEVTYSAEAAYWFEKTDITTIRTLAYILRPGTDWKDFGSIDIHIKLPENWEMTSNLDFTKEASGILSGHWEKLPANFLSIAIHRTETKAQAIILGSKIIIWILLVILCLWLIKKVAAFRLSRNIGCFLPVLGSALLSFLITAVYYAIFFYEFGALKYLLDDSLNPWVTYGAGYAILGVPFLWAGLFLLLLIIDFFYTRRLKRKLVQGNNDTITLPYENSHTNL